MAGPGPIPPSIRAATSGKEPSVLMYAGMPSNAASGTSSSDPSAMSIHAAYLVQADGGVQDQMDWNPDFSRRARGLGVYATLRSLGRSGVDDMITQTCRLARLIAERLGENELVEVGNDVVFNQVLIRWLAPDGDQDGFTDRLLAAVQADGTAYFSGTIWQGRSFMRISVADWATDESDVDRSVAALLQCAETARGPVH